MSLGSQVTNYKKHVDILEVRTSCIERFIWENNGNKHGNVDSGTIRKLKSKYFKHLKTKLEKFIPDIKDLLCQHCNYRTLLRCWLLVAILV